MKDRASLPAICFDFDGVFIKHNPDWVISPIPFNKMKLLPDCKEVINRIYKTHRIIISSTRFNADLNGTFVSGMEMVGVHLFLKSNAVKFDKISKYKEIAEYYIDDRGYKFETWRKLEEILRSEKAGGIILTSNHPSAEQHQCYANYKCS